MILFVISRVLTVNLKTLPVADTIQSVSKCSDKLQGEFITSNHTKVHIHVSTEMRGF